MSLLAQIAHNAQRFPALPALISVQWDGDREIVDSTTYAELDHGARSIAEWLSRQARPGDRVLLLYPAGIEFAQSFLGCLYAGLVPVPAPLPGDRQHHLTRTTGIALDADPAMVLTNAAHLDLVADWLVQDRLSHLVLHATDLVMLAEDDLGGTVPTAPVTYLQYPPTMDPTGLTVTPDVLRRSIDLVQQATGMTAGTRVGGWLPPHDAMGLIGMLLAPLSVGATAVLMSSADFVEDPVRWLRLIDSHRIEVTAAPNFAYDLCRLQADDETVAALDLSCLRAAVNGPEPVKPLTLWRFAARFAPAGFAADAFTPAYGMDVTPLAVAGTGPTVTIVSPWALEQNLFRPVPDGTAGIPFTSCGPVAAGDVRILAPTTRDELADGQVGEVWLAHDGKGYAGDLGVIHKGELYLTGRASDRIVLGGRHLWLHALEDEVSQLHRGLGPSCVCAVDIPREEIVVLQEVRSDEPNLTELAATEREMLGTRYGMRVTNVVFLRPGQIRRTAIGVVQRELMRELFLVDALNPIYEELGPQTQRRYRAFGLPEVG